jgi:murein DD-endopeptidase MepM/ murein hydrolase activator NlpD
LGKHATALLLTATAFAGWVTVASAQTGPGGAAAPTPGAPPPSAPAGSTPTPALTPAAPAPAPAPAISGISCRTGCTGLQQGAAGSVVHLAGSGMAGATLVVFMGGRGPRDDVRVAPTASADDGVDVPIPTRAAGGRLRVVGASGRWSKASTQRLDVGTAPPPDAPFVQAGVDSKRVFLDGRTRPSVSFFVGGKAPTQVRVDLVRDGDPAPVASWTPEPVAAGSVQTIAWDGALPPAAPPEGRYEFRVTALAGGAVIAAQARAQRRSARPAAAQADPAAPVATGFLLLDHAFPIQGPHQIGLQPSQRFGAQRGGHTHEGQDVFAACGTPLVAVHSGVILYQATQAAAGNYVVLREDSGAADYAYMHLRDPALVGRGVRVTTGQLLGYVGDTGDADGCHLHLEKWPAPGWYSGGAPVDPLPDLQAWDQTS